jgi:hypothetical protein
MTKVFVISFERKARQFQKRLLIFKYLNMLSVWS